MSNKKPVIVLKAGRTSAGARAAASHTGALAGNDKIYEDVLKQSGVVRARFASCSNSRAACRSCRRRRAKIA